MSKERFTSKPETAHICHHSKRYSYGHWCYQLHARPHSQLQCSSSASTANYRSNESWSTSCCQTHILMIVISGVHSCAKLLYALKLQAHGQRRMTGTQNQSISLRQPKPQIHRVVLAREPRQAPLRDCDGMISISQLACWKHDRIPMPIDCAWGCSV